MQKATSSPAGLNAFLCVASGRDGRGEKMGRTERNYKRRNNENSQKSEAQISIFQQLTFHVMPFACLRFQLWHRGKKPTGPQAFLKSFSGEGKHRQIPADSCLWLQFDNKEIASSTMDEGISTSSDLRVSANELSAISSGKIPHATSSSSVMAASSMIIPWKRTETVIVSQKMVFSRSLNKDIESSDHELSQRNFPSVCESSRIACDCVGAAWRLFSRMCGNMRDRVIREIIVDRSHVGGCMTHDEDRQDESPR